jgi:hypothetical protein
LPSVFEYSDLATMIEGSHWLEGPLTRSVPALLPRAGMFPPTVD